MLSARARLSGGGDAFGFAFVLLNSPEGCLRAWALLVDGPGLVTRLIGETQAPASIPVEGEHYIVFRAELGLGAFLFPMMFPEQPRLPLLALH